MTQENRTGDANARHQRLLALLRSATPVENECQSYLPRLNAYVATQLDGEDYLTRYPDIAFHLDRCVTCADSYARLYELELALAADTLPAPQAFPAPDLSFLTTLKAQAANSLLDLLAATLSTTANAIRLQLTADLLALLQPQQLAPLTRSSIDDSRYSEILYELLPEQIPATTLPIKLTAYRDSLYPEQSLLEVSVMPPDIHWPNLGGYIVTLEVDDDQMTQTTDAWGVVAFSDIPIVRLGNVTVVAELTQ